MLGRFCSLVATLLVVTCLAIAAPASVAGAATVDLHLEMVEDGGVLALRGGDPYSIATPTTVTGSADDETGALSGLAFATPSIAIERAITDPLPADVRIDASFRMLSPGDGTIDSDGHVIAELSVGVDLHVEVFPTGATEPLLTGDCVAEPVQLILASTAPYDGDSGELTLAAEDFTIPAVAGCDGPIGDGVNDELAGSGHSLSLSLEGAVPTPAPAGCDTTTALSVSPEGSSAIGEDVTLTANVETVADDPECIAAEEDGIDLSGAVDFYRGASIIGSGGLDASGSAVFISDGLPAGPQSLTARYRAVSPFRASTSAPVAHQVTVEPQITTSIPEFITIGQPQEFTVTVANPGTGFGSELSDVAVTVGLRLQPFQPVMLERFDGTTWVEVDRFGLNAARLPAFALSAGATHTEQLRLSVGTADLPPAQPASGQFSLEVVPADAPLADPPSAAALVSSTVLTSLVAGDRVPSIFSHGGQPVDAHTARAGQAIHVSGLTIGPDDLPAAQGTVQFLIGSEVMPAALGNAARPGAYTTSIPVNFGSVNGIKIPLPPDLPTGERQLTVRYSGDAHRLPHSETFPFTVMPPLGPSYECFGEGIPPLTFRANVVAKADVPQVVEPGLLDLGNIDIALSTDRSTFTAYNILYTAFELHEGTTNVGERGLRGVSFSVTGQEGSGTGVTLTNPMPLPAEPGPDPDPDQTLALEGEVGSAQIVGQPGDLVPLTLDSITLDIGQFGWNYSMLCTPVGEPASLGIVRVAGVELTVSPNDPVRAGDDVTLAAATGNPADVGVVEFLDGTDTIGVVPVAGGVASMTTSDLAVGDHVLRARFYRQPAAPLVISPEVPLTVLPELNCGSFTDEGAGRTVRLVYLSLLERCPDQAGYDYWVGQLESGVSQEAFASSISSTHEARRLVANDGYQTMLERDGSDADLEYWADYLRTRPYRTLLAAIGDAPEFRALAGSTDAGFVTRTYERLLGRAPEPAGLDYWVDRLGNGEPDYVMLTTFSRLREPTAAVVIQSYEEILDRMPTASELDAGVAFLRDSGDRSAFYGRLIGTDEFVARAQSLPDVTI